MVRTLHLSKINVYNYAPLLGYFMKIKKLVTTQEIGR